MCLIAKSELKMTIKFSSSFKLNEIHTVNSPFNEDPKKYFFQRGPNFEGGTDEKLGKKAITGTSIVMQIGDCEYRKRISAPPLVPNPCDASIFLHARPVLGKKMKNLNIHAKI